VIAPVVNLSTAPAQSFSARVFANLAERQRQRAALAPVDQKLTPRGRGIRGVLLRICSEYCVLYSELIGDDRHEAVCFARHHAAYELRVECNLSMPQIGRVLHKDYTTVRYGIGAHALRHGLPLPENVSLNWTLRTRRAA
jgi:chromosomal replication initiation ATPase DnaA